ncbi:hypothetical protein F5Y02DRAFT_419920 [Annulohypoxylon stygium]|nr:hypothetical protein F5Y02DRAFT_419920 [Annulohypoxylon stygium]
MALDGYSDILEALYERKVNFVNDIAPKLSMELSYFRWAGTNPEKRQTIVIMGDLTKKGYKFETAFKEWPINRVKAGVEQLAALHAAQRAATDGSRSISMHPRIYGLPWATESIAATVPRSHGVTRL